MTFAVKKTAAEHFRDWEGSAFGFGYGTGEPYILPALKHFMALCPPSEPYDRHFLEQELTPTVAWLLINVLARHQVDALEYGTSPRHAWLTENGRRLKAFIDENSADRLVEIVTEHETDYVPCYPDACNCGPRGFVDGQVCPNPFWPRR